MTLTKNGKPASNPSTINVVEEFDTFVEQLRDMLDTLQGRVSLLTNDLQVAADVSTRVATILNPDDLMPELVELVKDRFNLYHAHVYLLDEKTGMLNLAAGAGEAGQRMLQSGHSIPLDAEKSLVARAGRTQSAVLVDDVSSQPDWLPNPLLPDTRSEMAIPMIIGDNLIGVLDVQSEEVGRFTEIDRQVKTTLAGQLAVAVQNAETFAEVARNREELALVAEVSAEISQILDPEQLLPEIARLTADTFNLYHIHIWLADKAGEKLTVYAGDGRAPCMHVDRRYTIDVRESHSLVTEAALTRRAYIANNAQEDEVFEPSAYLPDTRSQITIPMVFGDDLIGVLDIHADFINAFSDEDITIHQALATQLAIAIQNARSFQTSQQRAVDLEIVSRVSAQIATILDPDVLLPELVELVKDSFRLYHTHVYLLDDAGVNLNLAAGAGEPGRVMLERGHSIPLDAEKSLVATAARTREGVLVSDVTQNPDWLPNDLLPDTQSELAIPMTIGDHVIGVLDVQSEQVGRFTEIDRQVKTTLAGQLAVAIENARTFEARRRAEQRETLAYSIGQQLNHEQDVQKLLQLAVDQLASAFNFYHAHIYVYEPDDDVLVVAAGLGEAGNVMAKHRHSILLSTEQSLVATAARNLEPVVVDDVTENVAHLPNPLIPETLSEVAVPLYLGTELLGVLDVQSNEVATFGVETVRLLSLVSNQLAVALSNARRLEETRLRLRDIGIANDVATIITESMTIPDMMSRVLAVVTDALGADNAVFTTLEEGGTVWQGVAGANMERDFITAVREPFSAFPHGVDAVETEQIITVDNAYEYEGFPSEYIESIGIKSVAVMPVIGFAGAIGVAFFNFNTEYHTFTDEEVALLQEIARQVSSGIENRRLSDTNQRLATLVDTSDNFIAYARLDNAQIIYVNEGGARLLKYDSTDALIGKTIPEVHTPEGGQRVIHEAVPLIMSGGIWLEENELLAKDGEVIPVEQNSFLLRDEYGEPFAIAAIMTDLRARKAAEAERNRILEMSLDMIGSAGFDGYFKELNPAWQRILGYTPEELKAKPFIEFVHPDDIAATNEAAAGLAEGVEAINFTNRYSTKDGNWRWVAWNSTPDYDRQMIYFIARDITEERKRDEEVNKRARELETVARIATEASNNMDMDSMLLNVANLTRDEFGLYHAHIYLLDDSGTFLDLAAGAGDAGREMKERGHRISLDREHSLVAKAAREHDGVIQNDVTRSIDFLPNPLLPETRAEMAIPIVANREVVGVLDVQANEIDRFTSEDVAIKTTLANQLAVAITNARQFQTEQEIRRESDHRARELETVAQVSAATSTILDTDELLLSVVNLTKTAFTLYHAHIYLYNEATDQLILAAGAGEAGEVMKKHGHAISYDNLTSIVARAARSREGVVINNVLEAEAFMPNPLLPNTRSEMAIPMLVGDDLVGVLDVQSEEVNRFAEADVRVKSTLAAQIAVAVENARTFQRTQQAAERERAAAERLREVDRLKSEFLASMSHELRTPLNSIIGYSEVLLDGGDGELPEEAAEDIDIIYTSGRHLLNIINDILDLAKIEANQMRLKREPVELVQLLKGVIKANQVLIGDRPVDLLFESEVDELIVPADELRVRQVVLNLFSNAVKFTDEGSVKIQLSMLDDETVKVAVEDTGTGIPLDGQQIVFDQFRQVDGSSTRKKGGTGLGLTITRHLVQMHGGEIYVESEEGVGSTFWFTLPLIEPEEEPIMG